jgi:hypothetical protein
MGFAVLTDVAIETSIVRTRNLVSRLSYSSTLKTEGKVHWNTRLYIPKHGTVQATRQK